MIDMSYTLGDRVVNTCDTNDYSVEVGDIGVITHVDLDDKVMTYKVNWPNTSYGVWWCNADLEPFTSNQSDDMECGWKKRALKAEAELKELKTALKTLSEG